MEEKVKEDGEMRKKKLPKHTKWDWPDEGGVFKLPDGDKHLAFFKSACQEHLFQVTTLGRIYEIVCNKNDEPKLMRVL